ncbi:hypothetical protein F2P81_019203 [Scophthalmus maximus]|uniref:Uncharacterized protein n=1 Tax=Scophthalmus maximus TaxID=52904 RepID=A0A6A4RZ10_SCOMX|nr:hypothetical protein F2P81_019203 [Scophthalmus maximus]
MEKQHLLSNSLTYGNHSCSYELKQAQTNGAKQDSSLMFLLFGDTEKSMKSNHKLQNDNGRRDGVKRLCSPTGHKLIILSSELQLLTQAIAVCQCASAQGALAASPFEY